MADVERYDAIVIGAGQGGGPLSTALVSAGRRTALIEREHVGGTCINEGCTPTKTMVASARAAYMARRGADYGVRNDVTGVDMVRVRQRKRDIVESFRGGSERGIVDGGVDLLMGEARFIGPKTIEVTLTTGGTRTLTAETIIINAGARPSALRIPGAEHVPILNSTSIMELDSVPEHLLVLGGGYVELEFGQMFRRFGSQVTIVHRGTQVLAREDADIAGEVADILREDGIEVLLLTQPVQVAQSGTGAIELTVWGPDGERRLSGSHLLAAVGRSPNTDTLGAEAAGLRLDARGSIPVNERLETNVPGIYAIGDVNGGPAFTHISY
ncbi:MAG: FAD-dependent oxidoreductase, partial [Ktedonobacterales bacterium]